MSNRYNRPLWIRPAHQPANLNVAAQTIEVSSVVHERAIGSHTVTPGSVAITPPSVEHTRAIGTALISQVVAPGSVIHTRAIGTVLISSVVAPASVVHTRAIGDAIVTPGSVTITVASVIHTRAIGDHDVSVITVVSYPVINVRVPFRYRPRSYSPAGSSL